MFVLSLRISITPRTLSVSIIGTLYLLKVESTLTVLEELKFQESVDTNVILVLSVRNLVDKY